LEWIELAADRLSVTEIMPGDLNVNLLDEREKERQSGDKKTQ
jgi:hypothetical protein